MKKYVGIFSTEKNSMIDYSENNRILFHFLLVLKKLAGHNHR